MKAARYALSAILLGSGWVAGQAGPSGLNPNEPISAERVEWALARLQKRLDARQNEIERPITASDVPQDPEQMRQELYTLRLQVKSVQQENTDLKSRVSTLTTEHKHMEQYLQEATRAAQMAAYAAEVQMYNRSWASYQAYPATEWWGSPRFPFLPAANGIANAPVFNPPAPGNAQNPRFTPRNFVGPQAAPNPVGARSTGASPAGNR